MLKYSTLSEEEYLDAVNKLVSKGYLMWQNGKVEPKGLILKPIGFIKATEIMDEIDLGDAILVSIKCAFERHRLSLL